MKNLIQKLGSYPYYVFGITVFFLTHGYSENAGLVPFSEILIFFMLAILISFLLLWVFKRRLGSAIKGGILSGLLIFFYLFYGAIKDGLKDSGFLYQLSRYSILLPAMITVTGLIYFFIKPAKVGVKKLTIYINTLMLLLILIDMISIAKQLTKKENADDIKKKVISMSMQPCEKCPRPDIYLIVLDEYAGTNTLKKYFNYNNNGFISFLKSDDFFVAENPSCNYTSTPLSMAATFDMKYIEWLKGRKNVQAEDYGMAAKSITNSITMNFLQSSGYKIKNYSIFDILDQPSKFNSGILPIKMKLITSKTLLGSMEKDLLWQVRIKIAPKFDWLADFFQNKFREGNNEMLKLTADEIIKNDSPKFVYCHLLLPHLPYLFDSTGKKNKINFFVDQPHKVLDDAYLSYLVYTNKIIKDIVSKIKKESHGNAVIIVMSDHGYRSFETSDTTISAKNNFNAVFLPKKNYGLFYDSMSNVNQFRIIFNSLFDQHLPMLKDSVVF